jgi:hypothetical protein
LKAVAAGCDDLDSDFLPDFFEAALDVVRLP